jgi:hypothetical protein
MSSRKRPSTPVNSVEMHVFSRQKQRPQAHQPSLVIASLFLPTITPADSVLDRALQPPMRHTPSFCRRKRKPAAHSHDLDAVNMRVFVVYIVPFDIIALFCVVAFLTCFNNTLD